MIEVTKDQKEVKVKEVKEKGNSRRRHPIIAGIIDWYYLIIFLSTLTAILELTMKRSTNLLTSTSIILSVYLISIIGVMIYHAKLATNTSFLSIGERLAGKEMLNNKKQWTNKYNRNRVGIFIVIFISIVLLSNYWNRSFYGYIYSSVEILSRLLRTYVITYILMAIINKRLNALLFLVGLRITVGISGYFIYDSSMLKGVTLKLHLFLAVLFLIIYFIYKPKSEVTQVSA